MKKHLQIIAALFVLLVPQAFSQNKQARQNNILTGVNQTELKEIAPITTIINDSLVGFNEQQTREIAPLKGITNEEMDIYMAISRREFIKSKYNLISKPVVEEINYSAKTTSAVCVNEDFEEAGLTNPVPTTLNITSANGINGWEASSGTNSGSNGSCVLTGCCAGAPNALQVIAPGPGGLVDPIIGSSYPIHSVFGNNLNTTATALNGFNCYGDWFTKINNSTGGAGLTRLTKTITVTPANVIFNFAYIAVVQSAHCCCDNGGVSIKFRDCLGNLLASASQFSISPPASAACTPSGTCSSPSTITVMSAPNFWYYNKWANSSIDLSLWMGSCIRVEVTGIDCPYSGHGGYAYFDAQCASTVVNSIHSLSNTANFKLYPNPSSGNFNIDVSPAINNGELELRNVLGQAVHKQQVKQGNNQITTQNLAKGIYTYSILQNKELINAGKLVIE